MIMSFLVTTLVLCIFIPKHKEQSSSIRFPNERRDSIPSSLVIPTTTTTTTIPPVVQPEEPVVQNYAPKPLFAVATYCKLPTETANVDRSQLWCGYVRRETKEEAIEWQQADAKKDFPNGTDWLSIAIEIK
jgi:hypothetical protein